MPRTPDERATLAKHDPELLRLLDDLEKRPYATTQKLREQEAAALRANAIVYGPAEHKANPFVNGASETEKARFIATTPADVVAYYKAQAEPIQLPANNLTVRSKLALNPRLAALAAARGQNR